MSLSLEWLAGFVDGEGCIDFNYRSTTGRATKEKTVYPRLVITNTHLPTLLRIREEFGGALSPQGKSKKYNKNARQSYHLAWGSRASVLLLKRLLPFLVTKKEQAAFLLEQWYTLPHGTKIGADEHKHREWIKTQLQEMKRTEFLLEEVQ